MTSSRLDDDRVGTPPDPAEAAASDETIFETPAVLRIIWADPQHMAEHIAVWSLARFGPRAASAVQALHERQPAPVRDELERLVVDRQTRVATTEGAFVGGPFIVLIPFAFCAALLAQAQMVFALAAVAGRNPNDERRAAELLVLLGAYPSVDDATAALAALPRNPGQRDHKRLPAGTRWGMVKRMAYLLEIFGPADESRSRLRATLGWLGIGALFVVGLVLPLVWVPYMAYSSRRSTLRMARRARSFYSESRASEAGIVVQRGGESLEVGGTAAFVRMALLIVLPVVVAVVALVTGFGFVGGRWLTAGVLLLAASALATSAWLGYRWWRHRRSAGR